MLPSGVETHALRRTVLFITLLNEMVSRKKLRSGWRIHTCTFVCLEDSRPKAVSMQLAVTTRGSFVVLVDITVLSLNCTDETTAHRGRAVKPSTILKEPKAGIAGTNHTQRISVYWRVSAMLPVAL